MEEDQPSTHEQLPSIAGKKEAHEMPLVTIQSLWAHQEYRKSRNLRSPKSAEAGNFRPVWWARRRSEELLRWSNCRCFDGDYGTSAVSR